VGSGATVELPSGAVAWGDVSKAGSTLNDLVTLSTSKAITGTTLDLAANGLAGGDVNKAGSTLDDLVTLSTSKAVTGTAAFFSGAGTIGGALVVTGTSRFENLMTVNANGDFDSISVAGVSDLTSITNSGANPITINDDLVVTGTLTLGGYAWTISEPITISGVLTNVRVLYYVVNP